MVLMQSCNILGYGLLPNIIGPFWLWIRLPHLIFGVPKWDPNFGNYPNLLLGTTYDFIFLSLGPFGRCPCRGLSGSGLTCGMFSVELSS